MVVVIILYNYIICKFLVAITHLHLPKKGQWGQRGNQAMHTHGIHIISLLFLIVCIFVIRYTIRCQNKVVLLLTLQQRAGLIYILDTLV